MRAADRPSFVLRDTHILESTPLQRSDDRPVERRRNRLRPFASSPPIYPSSPQTLETSPRPEIRPPPPITITADRVETDRGSDASSPNNPPPPPPELFGRV